jgi:hypothetical protein
VYCKNCVTVSFVYCKNCVTVSFVYCKHGHYRLCIASTVSLYPLCIASTVTILCVLQALSLYFVYCKHCVTVSFSVLQSLCHCIVSVRISHFVVSADTLGLRPNIIRC